MAEQQPLKPDSRGTSAKPAAAPESPCGPGEVLYVAGDFGVRVVNDVPGWGASFWSRTAGAAGEAKDRLYYRLTPEVFAWVREWYGESKARLAALDEALGGKELSQGGREKASRARQTLAEKLARAVPRLRALKAHFLAAFPGVVLDAVVACLPPAPAVVPDDLWAAADPVGSLTPASVGTPAGNAARRPAGGG